MFEPLVYLVALLGAISGLIVLDHRFKLALFYDRIRTLKVVGIGTLVFVVWDLLGIANGIFKIGDSVYMAGIRLAHEFPLEELFFLILLVYNALLLWRAGEKLWPRT